MTDRNWILAAGTDGYSREAWRRQLVGGDQEGGLPAAHRADQPEPPLLVCPLLHKIQHLPERFLVALPGIGLLVPAAIGAVQLLEEREPLLPLPLLPECFRFHARGFALGLLLGLPALARRTAAGSRVPGVA